MNLAQLETASKDQYFVAVKAFLVRNEELFIFKDRFGDWDLPGGRLTVADFETPLEMVLRRKLSQELGDQFSYDVGKQVALMRHQRVEATATKPTVHIFAVGYECIFRSGSIRLSTQHIESKWAPIETLDPNDYFSGGWLAGVETYLQYRLGSS